MFFLISVVAQAQPDPLSNRRVHTIPAGQDSILLDSLTVIPHSVRVLKLPAMLPVDSNAYRVEDQLLIWQQPVLADSIRIIFRVFPYSLQQDLTHRDSNRIQRAVDGTYIGFDYSPYEEDEQPLIEFKGLDYNGSFARGLSFGNSQNLVLNSSFNLQLSGQLGDDVEILAAITDNSIPLQPEGNTAQLQEFDKIFIQLKRNDTKLIAGDYELNRPNSYFMNYFKKLQGATVSTATDLFATARFQTKVSGAISRGKFARNIIQAIEGNQGPYKLQGNEGERFIIIESGTEQVYIDGRLMQRGIEQDYVIDYNRGDISFTTNRLITKDSRIIVEFQYSDQNFVRSMYAVSTDFESDRLKLHLNVYSEQDGKSSVQQDLDTLDRARLRRIGDDLSRAFRSGIDTLTETANPITYRLIDTLVNGITYDSVLVYSVNTDSARYVARFSLVGAGNGDYRKVRSGANGQVFEWIAPQGGLHRGDYAPVIRLVAPQKQQMFSFGASYQLGDKSTVSAELALSNTDLNRFSQLDSEDDVGIALFTKHQYERNLGKEDQGWTLETELNYELVQKHFRALNPYRNAEFTRDWNLRTSNLNAAAAIDPATENIFRGGFALRKHDLGVWSYEFGSFFRQSLYTGTKHSSSLVIDKDGFFLSAQGSLLQAEDQRERSEFFRPKIEISQSFNRLNNWKIGIYGEREKNNKNLLNQDTLSQNSFYYDLFRVFLKSPEEGSFGFGADYVQRFDYAPVGLEFQQNTLAEELNLNGSWITKKGSQLRWNMSYRQLHILNDELTNQEAQETYLGRIDYNLSKLKGAIRFTNSYQIGSGQEPRIEFNYLEVNPGEGIYTWIDRNRDSVKQINEFEIAPFQDQANHLRVSIFTDEFIRTNNVQFNQSLRLSPKAIWFREEGLKKLLSRFSTQSTLKIIRRVREADGVSPWNPFQLNIVDSSLVSVSSTIRNTLFFNRADPKFDFQLGQMDNRNQVILTTGAESRRNGEQFFRGRWNVNTQFTTEFNLATVQRENNSEFFDERDYLIQSLQLQPKFTWLVGKNFRSILSYEFESSENILSEGAGETAISNDFNIELTFNQSSKASIRGRFSFVNIDYQGERNTPVEFAMLEGLQNGRNFLWNLTFDRLLANNIQLSFSYEGRKTGKASVVHLGRAQVRATF